jgi:hypothetical protein
MVRNYDRSSKRTTLINDDDVRVYKEVLGETGRIDPAQRRYFPQDMATDYIGFRCAMSRVVRNLTEGKHRGISFYKITIPFIRLFFNRFKWI